MCFQEARICTVCGCQAYKWEICPWRENASQLYGNTPEDRRNRWRYTKDPCRNCADHATEDGGVGGDRRVYNPTQSRILSTQLWDTCVYLVVLSGKSNLRWRCSVCKNINTSGPQCRFFRVVDPDTVEDNQLPPGVSIPRATGPSGGTRRGGRSQSGTQQTVLLERCGHMISQDCSIISAVSPYEEKLLWDSPFPFAKKPVSLKATQFEIRDKYIFGLPPFPPSFPPPGRGLFVPPPAPIGPQATPAASSNIESELDLDPRERISGRISLPVGAPSANTHQRNIAPLPIVKTERDSNPVSNTVDTGARSVSTNTRPNNLESFLADEYRRMGYGDVIERYMDLGIIPDDRTAVATPSVHPCDPKTAVLPIIKKEEDHAGATAFSNTTTSASTYGLAAAVSTRDHAVGTSARGGYPTNSQVNSQANKVTKPSSRNPGARARDTRFMTRLRGQSNRRAGSDDGGEYVRNPDVVREEEEEARSRPRDPNAKFIDSLRGDESDEKGDESGSDQLRRNPLHGFPSEEAIAKQEQMEEEEMEKKGQERLQTRNLKSATTSKDQPRQRRSTIGRHGAAADSHYATSPSKRRRTHGDDGSSSRSGSVGPGRGSTVGEQRPRVDGTRKG